MAAFFNDNTKLINIFGYPSYDNLSEPKPFTNTPGCLIGFTTAFLVRNQLLLSTPSQPRFGSNASLGTIMDIRMPPTFCSLADGPLAGVG